MTCIRKTFVTAEPESRVVRCIGHLLTGKPPERVGSYFWPDGGRLASVASFSQRGDLADGSTRRRIHMPALACPGTPLTIRYEPVAGEVKRRVSDA